MAIQVHLVDGTYELFRHFYGARRAAAEQADRDPPEGGETRVGSADDADDDAPLADDPHADSDADPLPADRHADPADDGLRGDRHADSDAPRRSARDAGGHEPIRSARTAANRDDAEGEAADARTGDVPRDGGSGEGDVGADWPSDLLAVRGVVSTVLQMLESGATHVGVATDHVIESFRNRLWPGYKTGEGVDPSLLAQFHPLEEALEALGVAVWAMVEYEADDALAAAARIAARDEAVAQVCIWTPDKDLAQCVRDRRVVQVDRRSGSVRDEEGVVAKFGVSPTSIPDYLALVGDSADGFPGLPGWGAKTAARVLARYPRIEDIPERSADWGVRVRGAPGLAATLAAERKDALLFRRLATLRADLALFDEVDEVRWRGPTPAFRAVAERLGAPELAVRAHAIRPTDGP